jgi:deoxyribodipyrimidine photo-lyase
MTGTSVVLFTRDLRVHDHPALSHAVETSQDVVPLFVFDQAILGSDLLSPNRLNFLYDSLVDLDQSLRERGAHLIVRQGDVVREAMRVVTEAGAQALLMSEDVSSYAQARESRLRSECQRAGIAFETFPGINVISLDSVETKAGGHYKVFTPYLRAWQISGRRKVLRAPRAIEPGKVASAPIPQRNDLVRGLVSSNLISGGETEGRARMVRWMRSSLENYNDLHDDLASDGTSRLSAFLHFGCVSPRELEEKAKGKEGGSALVRQLAWRDFYHQVNRATPNYPRMDYRTKGDRWRRSEKDLRAWKEGRTGYPIVDAGMRQLLQEGWMHNRARLITSSFLVKDLYIDWRKGAAHFFEWLVDGDVANNAGNWQWVAGTGNDTRPNRILNPLRQAERFDPEGTYVRRYLPELAHIEGKAVHRPWELPANACNGYPLPIVDHSEAVERFRSARKDHDDPE